jgi:CRP/FNR family transcriptional regulator
MIFLLWLLRQNNLVIIYKFNISKKNIRRGIIMKSGELGKTYKDKEVIIRQGESGNSMYVIQSGEVEVLRHKDGAEVQLAIRREGDFFGEMALFSRKVRSATIRALGEARVLTIDRKNLLNSIQKDPSLAFRIIETLSKRIRDLSEEIAPYKIDK